MCPILTSTTSQGAIFIISPILHNLTSITFQGAILCGHNFPIPLLHHPDVLPAEVRATRWCPGAGSSTPSQTTREKPLFSLEVTKMTMNSRLNIHRRLSEQRPAKCERGKLQTGDIL